MLLVVLVAVFLGICRPGRRRVRVREPPPAGDDGRSRASGLEPDDAASDRAMIIKDEESASAMPLLNRLLAGRALTDRLALELERAGVGAEARRRSSDDRRARRRRRAAVRQPVERGRDAGRPHASA